LSSLVNRFRLLASGRITLELYILRLPCVSRLRQWLPGLYCISNPSPTHLLPCADPPRHAHGRGRSVDAADCCADAQDSRATHFTRQGEEGNSKVTWPKQQAYHQVPRACSRHPHLSPCNHATQGPWTSQEGGIRGSCCNRRAAATGCFYCCS
jgi:hypothetical protein